MKYFKQNEIDNINYLISEHKLRMKLRNIILEQSAFAGDDYKLLEVEDPTTDVHDNTGINTLKDLLKNTNVLATLRNVYKTLTTSDDQKDSFRAHIIKWTQDTLAPVKLNDTDAVAGSESELDLSPQLTEKMGIDIEGVDANKFIQASDGSEKDDNIIDDEPEEDEELATLSGKDGTGRNKAERV